MRVFVAAMALMVAGPAMADWVKIEEKVEVVNRPNDIYELITGEGRTTGVQYFVRNELTRRVSGLLPSVITELEIQWNTYQWSGPNNSCDADDPRQFASSDNGDLRFTNGGAGGWATSIMNPGADWDPCAKSALQPKLERSYTDTRK